MSLGGGRTCYGSEVAIAVTFGGSRRRRDDPRRAGCLELL